MEGETATTTAPPAAENGSGDNVRRGGGRKEDQVPIEELYDLSKPIPKVRLSLYRFYVNCVPEIARKERLGIFYRIKSSSTM